MNNNNKDIRIMFVIVAVFAASMLSISVVVNHMHGTKPIMDSQLKRKTNNKNYEYNR